jgi:hypothetical protein
VDEAVLLDDLTAENLADHLRPAAEAVAHLPSLHVGPDEVAALAHGRRISRAADGSDAPAVAAYDPRGELVGIVAPDGAEWRPVKILAGG